MSDITYKFGDQVHTGDYFVYEVVEDKGETVVVTPAYGYNTQWGEKGGEDYEYFKHNLYPGDGTNR